MKESNEINLILILIILILSSKGLNCQFNFYNWNIKWSEGHYKLGEYICYKNIKNEGYYLDNKNGDSVWKKCYENCNTCHGEGTLVI